MDDSSSLPETITPRKASTASRRTTVSDSGTRKPASIYEINELYQALQDLVHSSPAPEIRRVRASGTNFDSSDSWTSGADSPDVRSRVPKKNVKVIRSSSNILARFVITVFSIYTLASWGRYNHLQHRRDTPLFSVFALALLPPPVNVAIPQKDCRIKLVSSIRNFSQTTWGKGKMSFFMSRWVQNFQTDCRYKRGYKRSGMVLCMSQEAVSSLLLQFLL